MILVILALRLKLKSGRVVEVVNTGCLYGMMKSVKFLFQIMGDKTMETLKKLEEMGGILETGTVWRVMMPNGEIWVEMPSENGNGWYAGDFDNSDNLLFEKA